jgi:hypothetical protein
MAHLSKQDEVAKQDSLLKILIHKAAHECIFLPKFHWKLNLIEMVGFHNLIKGSNLIVLRNIGGDASTTATKKSQRRILLRPKMWHSSAWMHAQSMFFGTL